MRVISDDVDPAGGYMDGFGRRVSGSTFCDLAYIHVGWPEAGWAASSAVHELVHVQDRCATPNHEGWTDAHVFEAIEAARAR